MLRERTQYNIKEVAYPVRLVEEGVIRKALRDCYIGKNNSCITSQTAELNKDILKPENSFKEIAN